MRDPRPDNFIEAYLNMGYSSGDAHHLGNQRAREDRDALFIVEGCTDFSTAKVTVWLLEAAQALCVGDLGKDEAIRLIELARRSLEAVR
jgi:hypothetical protein